MCSTLHRQENCIDIVEPRLYLNFYGESLTRVFPQYTFILKGQCHEIFDFRFSTWIRFPQAPDYTIRAVSNFLRKFAEIFGAQDAPPVSLTPVANGKKSSIRKIFIISVAPLFATGVITLVAICHRRR
jgi:hypothetical protein